MQAINDPPVAIAASLTTNEDTPTGGTLGATDADSASVQRTIVANGVSVTVQDNGGIANGGVGSSAPPQTFTIFVTPVNDPPIATDDFADTPEDTALIFNAADLTGNDSPGPNESEQQIAVTAVMNALNGTVQLVEGQVTFTPNANYHGMASFEYTIQDDDDGPLSDVGKVHLDVTSVNDAPASADATVAGAQNAVITFGLADFAFADASDTPANTFTRVKITAPTAGALSVGDTTLAADSFVDVADIVAGNLKFTPAADATGVPYATFTFQVEDSGGTDNGGVNLASPNTMFIIVWKLTAMTNCGFEGDSPAVVVSGNAVTLGQVVGATFMPNCVHGVSALLPPLAAGMTNYEVPSATTCSVGIVQCS